MTITELPWFHPRPRDSQIHLEVVPRGVIDALARGEADMIAARYVSPYLMGSDCRSLWLQRSEQFAATPSDIPWVTRLIRDPEATMPVGAAGFDSGPDEKGIVGINIRVDPSCRLQPYGRHALDILLSVAQRHPEVQTLRVAVPTDELSMMELIAEYGFTSAGDRFREGDELRMVFEVSPDL